MFSAVFRIELTESAGARMVGQEVRKADLAHAVIHLLSDVLTTAISLVLPPLCVAGPLRKNVRRQPGWLGVL